MPNEKDIDTLIKDFYAKYEPKRYSSQEVQKVKEFYGDNHELMIKDFYAKYAPEEYSTENVAKITEFYGLKKKDKPVSEISSESISQPSGSQLPLEVPEEVKNLAPEQAQEKLQQMGFGYSQSNVQRPTATAAATVAGFTEPVKEITPEQIETYNLVKQASQDLDKITGSQYIYPTKDKESIPENVPSRLREIDNYLSFIGSETNKINERINQINEIVKPAGTVGGGMPEESKQELVNERQVGLKQIDQFKKDIETRVNEKKKLLTLQQNTPQALSNDEYVQQMETLDNALGQLNKEKGSYLWGAVKNIGLGVSSVIRTLDNATVLVGDMLGYGLEAITETPREQRVKEVQEKFNKLGQNPELFGFNAQTHFDIKPDERILGGISNWMDTHAESIPDNPNTTLGRAVGAVEQIVPSFGIPIGGIKYLSKLDDIPALFLWMGGSEGVNNYAKAREEGKTPEQSILEYYKGVGTGTKDAALLTAFGMLSGKIGGAITKATGSETAGAVTGGISLASMFGGETAMEQIIKYGDVVNPEAVWDAVAMGLVFEGKGMAEGKFNKLFKGEDIKNTDIDKAAVLEKVVNREKTAFFNSTSETFNLIDISKKEPVDFYKQANEMREKAAETESKDQRNALIVASSALDNMGMAKAYYDAAKQNPNAFKEEINKSDLPQEKKTELISRIDKGVANDMTAGMEPQIKEIERLQKEKETIENNTEMSPAAKDILIKEVNKKINAQEKIITEPKTTEETENAERTTSTTDKGSSREGDQKGIGEVQPVRVRDTERGGKTEGEKSKAEPVTERELSEIDISYEEAVKPGTQLPSDVSRQYAEVVQQMEAPKQLIKPVRETPPAPGETPAAEARIETEQARARNESILMVNDQFNKGWDTAKEEIVKQVQEKGRLSEAIESGLVKFKESDWYRKLPKEEQVRVDEAFKQYFQEEFGKKSKPKKTETQKQIDKTVEGKPKELIQEYRDFKQSLQSPQAFKAGARNQKAAQSEIVKSFEKFINDNSARINQVNAKLKSIILKKVARIKNEKTLNDAIEYVDRALEKQEYVNEVSNAEANRKRIKAVARTTKGKNVFGNKNDIVQQMLRIEPDRLTYEELTTYNDFTNKAVDAIKKNSKVPDIKPIEQVLQALKDRIEVNNPDIREIKTKESISNAIDKLSDIETIEDINDYRSVINKVSQVAAKAKILLRERKITNDEFNKIIEQVNNIYTKAQDKDLSLSQQAAEFKNEMVKYVKSKQVNTEGFSEQKKEAIDGFMNIKKDILKQMDIRDIDSYGRIIDGINDGFVSSEMYVLKDRAARIEAKQKLEAYIEKIKNNKRFKSLSEKDQNKIINDISSVKGYRIDQDLFGSISEAGLYENVYTPLSDAIVKMKTEYAVAMNDFVKAYQRMRRNFSNIPGTNYFSGKKTEEVSKQIGMLLTEKDWRSNLVKDPESNREYTWEEAPPELKSIVDYTQKFKKDNSVVSSKEWSEEVEIWNELKEKYADENGLVNIDKALNDLSKNKFVKNYIESYRQLISSLEPFTEVATENRGRYFEKRENFTPSKVKEIRKQEEVISSLLDDKSIDNLIGKMKGSHISVEAGSTNTRTNYPYIREYDISKLAPSHAKEILTDYYLAGQLKSTMGALRDAGKSMPESKKILDAVEKDLQERILREINKDRFDQAQKTFQKLLRYTKYMSLARIDRIPRELLANSLRALISEGVTPIEYKRAGNEAYKQLINEGISEKDMSQYQEEIENPGKLTEKAGEKYARKIITTADTMIGRTLFSSRFNKEFEKLSGSEFSEEKYLNDSEYRKNNETNINKARTTAIRRIEELFNSKKPLSTPTKVKFFGAGFKKGHPLTDLLYYMQSFNHNEIEQVKASMYRIAKGNAKERAQGFRDITSIMISNYVYLQSTFLVNEIYKALATDIIDDDEKSEIENALQAYYDKHLDQSAIVKDIMGSLVSLSSGKYSNIAKDIASVTMPLIENVAKNKGVDKEEWFQKSYGGVKDLAQNAWFAKPISKYGRTDQALTSLIPAVGDIYSNFTDLGIDIVDLSTKKRDDIKTDDEKAVWDLINVINRTISLILPNPASPTIDKISGYVSGAKNKELKNNTGSNKESKRYTGSAYR